MDNAGIEPAASSTLRRHSTTELIAHRINMGTKLYILLLLIFILFVCFTVLLYYAGWCGRGVVGWMDCGKMEGNKAYTSKIIQFKFGLVTDISKILLTYSYLKI